MTRPIARRTLWLLVGVLLIATPSRAQNGAVTNDDITKMVAAGLSEEVIVGFVRQAPARSFDTSPAALIALKDKGVPQGVITAMLQPFPSASPSGAAPAVGNTGGSDELLAPRTPGFYADLGEGKSPRLQALSTARVTNVRGGGGALRALSGGLAGSKNVNYRVAGQAATLRVSNTATFYYYSSPYAPMDPSSLILLKLAKKGKEREYTAATAGGPGGMRGSQGDVELTAETAAPGIYRLRPKNPLAPGEYALAATAFTGPGQVYDFGVD